MKMKKLLISSLFLTSLFTLSSCSFITNIFGPDDDDDITSAQTTTSTSTSTNTSTQTSTNTSTSTQTSTITSIVQTYTLTFDPNGGEGTSVSISGKEIGDLIYLPDCSFVNAGFSFYGWYDGQNTYQANDEYEVIGNVTFKALWDNEKLDNDDKLSDIAENLFTGINL